MGVLLPLVGVQGPCFLGDVREACFLGDPLPLVGLPPMVCFLGDPLPDSWTGTRQRDPLLGENEVVIRCCSVAAATDLGRGCVGVARGTAEGEDEAANSWFCLSAHVCLNFLMKVL